MMKGAKMSLANWIAAVFALSACAGHGVNKGAEVDGAASSRSCLLYDGTQYLNKPLEFSKLIPPVGVWYVRHIWSPPSAIDQMPRKELIRSAIAKFEPQGILVLDLEHWPVVGSADTVAQTVEKLSRLIDWTREELPLARLGYYGIVPLRDYWRAQMGEGSHEYQAWQRENDRLSGVVAHSDILFPSAYTFYADINGWERFVRENMKEARRIGNGRAVYLFLWPEFHDSTPLRHSFLPPEMWVRELEVACDLADGVVIWGGYDLKNKRRRDWDADAPWWKATLEFARRRPADR